MALYYLIYFGLIYTVTCQRGFTLILDTTASMTEEVNIIKANIQVALNVARSSEYILMPFNNPDIGPPLVFTTAEDFISHLDLVEVAGGQKCPEKSLSALEMALEKGKSFSNIYLFTDAIAEYEERAKIENISLLCKQRHSQVYIFQSGKCFLEPSNDFYQEVASLCSGAFYKFDYAALKKVFGFIKETMRLQWTPAYVQEVTAKAFGWTHYTFAVDMHTSDILVGVSGSNLDVHVSNDLRETVDYDRIMYTRNSSVVGFHNIAPGEYNIEVYSETPETIYAFTHKELTFQYGFSPKTPRSINETSERPIPGTKNNILIVISGTDIELLSIELLKSGDIIKINFKLMNTMGHYVAKHLFEPGLFRLSITAKYTKSNQIINGASKVIETQHQGMVTEWMNPSCHIVDDEGLIDFGTKATFACKIDSFPRPDVWWEDDSGTMPSDTVLLDVPSTYISYMTIDNATRNGTIYCKAKNAVGTSDSSVNIFINRTFVFEVLQYPSDITVEYGDTGKLYCEVNAYPEADVKWSHNNTEVDSERVEINSEEHYLFIKNMDVVDAGEYVCDINNEVESITHTATVYITGLEAPTVQIEITELTLKPGDWTQQMCTIIKGKPAPTIAWKYKLENAMENDFLEIPEGVFVSGNILKISSAQTNHGGIYICEANNSLGVDRQGVLVKVQYQPRIKNQDESLKVKQGDEVALPCDVDAVPKADVHWDMSQGDVIIGFDHRHYTDASNRHRFAAQLNDSGTYHCIANNSMGTATRTVNVNVWVAPYIQPPVSNNITKNIGSTLYLDCFINFGNPQPSTRWEFVSTNTHITVLTTGHSTGRLVYQIQDLKKQNEGTYRCIAENDVGVDIINLYLKIV